MVAVYVSKHTINTHTQTILLSRNILNMGAEEVKNVEKSVGCQVKFFYMNYFI